MAITQVILALKQRGTYVPLETGLISAVRTHNRTGSASLKHLKCFKFDQIDELITHHWESPPSVILVVEEGFGGKHLWKDLAWLKSTISDCKVILVRRPNWPMFVLMKEIIMSIIGRRKNVDVTLTISRNQSAQGIEDLLFDHLRS